MSAALTPDLAFPIAEINQAFLLGVLKIDPVIKDRTKKIQHSFWRSMFPRGVFPYGQGITERVQQFEGPLPDQNALTAWHPLVAETKVDSQGNVTDDPCNQLPDETMKIGFTTRTYTGYQRAIKTDWICLNEIKWKWQFQQQLALTFEGLADFTLSVWDNHAQKSYLTLGQGYLASDSIFGPKVTYNAFSSANITFPVANMPILPTVRWLRQLNQYYALQAERYAIGGESGAPVFGLITHPDDFDQLMQREGPIYTAFLNTKPELLLEGYGKVKEFQQWGLMYDNRLPRFRIKSNTGGVVTLEPVLPYKTEPTTVGEAVLADPAYIKAEFTIMGVFLKEQFEVLVPPFNPTSPGGGTRFNNEPTFNGEFRWKNIETNNSENPWGEKGRYLARYQAFNKPGAAYRDMAWFLVRRSAKVPQVYELGDSATGFAFGQPYNPPTAVTAPTIVNIEAVDPDPTNSGYYTTAVLTLSAPVIGATLGATLTVADKAVGTTAAVTVAETYAANVYRYKVIFASAANWAALGTQGIIGGAIHA